MLKEIQNKTFRINLAKSSYYWFFHLYFAKYITCPTADFHKKWCRLLEDWNEKFIEIIGFRGSSKTTYSMLGFPIWAMITEKSHYTLILGDTFNQIKEHIYNIKNELETNELLINDFGPFEGKELWTSTDIIVPQYNSKISARSIGQKVRGIRYKQWRPTLIIGDDLENLESVRTREQREKTYRWFTGDVIPAGDKETKIILIGNLLHQDCLMNRMANEIKSGQREGKLWEIPLIKNGEISWKGKYPDMEAIEKQKRVVNNEKTWQREYMLKIISEEGQLFKEEFITYYQSIPNLKRIGIGVDLAAGQAEANDYSVIVVGGADENNNFYTLKVVRMKERFGKVAEAISRVYHSFKDSYPEISVTLGVENVAYQLGMIQELQDRYGLPVKGITRVKDKRARLEVLTPYWEAGKILFNRDKEQQVVIDELVGFGIEAHDDAADGFEIAHQLIIRGGTSFNNFMEANKDAIQPKKENTIKDLYEKQKWLQQ